MIIKEFETPSHTVRIFPSSECVGLDIDGCPFALPWDKASDVEYLANGFGHLLVMDFRVIVKELGIAYNNKDLYLSL